MNEIMTWAEAVEQTGEMACSTCHETKPLSEFVKAKGRAFGVRRECKDCHNAKNRAWAEANPERYKEIHENAKRKHRYGKLGISEEIFQEMLKRQAKRCAICKKKQNGERLRVDHDHVTGKVRGLLCKNCNLALGNFKDNPVSLARAIEYLTGTVTIS